METLTTPQFNAVQYKQTTFEQWQSAAAAWFKWSPAIRKWLGKATDEMIALAEIIPGHHVLDVAAGAGEQTISIARIVGPSGYVLATDISPNILTFARKMACEANLYNIETSVMDGEDLLLADESFNAVISRVGLIYFPDQHQALREMWRVLKPGGKVAAIVYSTPEKNAFFSIPVSIIRKRAMLPPPVPGQPGPFSLGGEGVIGNTFIKAGFKNVRTIAVDAPVHMSSAKECVQFEKESFGALHQMMGKLTHNQIQSIWEEIEQELATFETSKGFTGPCEMLIAVGEK